MPLKPIVTIPDPVLRKISEPVEKLTNEELKLIKDLEDTMYEANGIGLAAIQVGIPKRIVVIDVSKDAKFKKPIVPGDILKIHIKLIKKRLGLCKFKGECFVESDLVACSNFSANIVDRI